MTDIGLLVGLLGLGVTGRLRGARAAEEGARAVGVHAGVHFFDVFAGDLVEELRVGGGDIRLPQRNVP